ncbi:MAG: DUF4175 family protein, partial [bacterium]
MTPKEDNTQRENRNFLQSLTPTLWFHNMWTAFVHVMVFLASVVILTGIVGLLDWVLHFPWWLRGTFLIGILSGGYFLTRKLYSTDPVFTLSGLAARLENLFPGLRDRLVTAAEITEGRIDTSNKLRHFLVRRGRRLLGTIRYRTLLLKNSNAWGALVIGISLVALFSVGYASPEGLLRHGGRIFLPGARIYPHTNTHLHWPDEVQFVEGKDATIDVYFSGTVPDHATLWAYSDQNGWERYSMKPLGRRDNGTFHYRYTLPRPANSFEYYVTGGDITSFVRWARMLVPPDIENLLLSVQFPNYTGRSSQTFKPGPLRVVKGSTVTLRTNFDPRGSQGQVRLSSDTTGKNVKLRTRSDSKVAQFTVDEPLTWAIRARSPDGVRTVNPDTRKIEIMPDHAPEISVQKPPQEHSVFSV